MDIDVVTDQNSHFIYISEQSQLDQFCQSANSQPVLALDTEFVRTRTLNAQLGLIQAFDGQHIVLIDPLTALDLTPFWQLLSNPNIVKVLHSCHEDLEVFKLYAGCLPEPLFDTQIAGQFLFQGRVLGFAAMVQQELGIELDKGEARTNWLKRPLSATQLDYAANDVRYLLPVYHRLNEQLQFKGLTEYNLNEAHWKVLQKSQSKDENLLFLDFGNAWQLNSKQLAVLQALAKWRYDLAKRKDLALGFVAKDSTLFSLAQAMPTDESAMRKVQGIPQPEARIHGKAMLTIIRATLENVDVSQYQRVPRLTDYPNYKQAFKSLKQGLTNKAEKLGIPIEMLATKKLLNQWIGWAWQVPYCQPSDLQQSWRGAIVQDVLDKWQHDFPKANF